MSKSTHWSQSRSTLKPKVRSKYYFFYGHQPDQKGNFLSQWYQCQFIENGIHYTSAEQYMMAHKALLFKDDKIFGQIMALADPRYIKSLGRRVANYDDDIWNEHKYEIVIQGNRLKFRQNPSLLKKLLATKKHILVEASPSDKIWGIGLDKEHAKKISSREWPGQNLLGKALMEVRAELRKK